MEWSPSSQAFRWMTLASSQALCRYLGEGCFGWGWGWHTMVQGLRPSLSSLPGPQAALQAAAHASVDVKNVLDFYKQWKEIG